MEITFKINGRTITQDVKPGLLLLEMIRDILKLKGTKPGCLEGECGACSVIIDGKAINSCMCLAINAHGKEIITIEGLVQKESSLDNVQEKMLEHGAVQCGFCTSGMVMATKAYSDKCKADGYTPSREQVKRSLEGNLCRCTGYQKIIDAAEAVYKD
jgi:carbon-monoxide dehydrogenase small subunit|tara:strand:+ start:197 stop:667 length:471 start_codon:yes stop_codon:yes gene_type:complete